MDAFAFSWPQFDPPNRLPMNLIINKVWYRQTRVLDVADFDLQYEEKCQYLRDFFVARNLMYDESDVPYEVGSYKGLLTKFYFTATNVLYKSLEESLDMFQ